MVLTQKWRLKFKMITLVSRYLDGHTTPAVTSHFTAVNETI